MTDSQLLLERNQKFASSYTNSLSIMPRFSTIILTCVDARVDPAHFLGLEAGDALVIRNAGGRVTPDVELELGMLWAMVQNMQGDNFKGLNLAIIHHSDCGMEKIANPQMILGLSQRLDVDKSKIEALAIHNHEQSLNDDIQRLRSSSIIPKALRVTAYLMNLDDGLIREVVPEKALG